MAVLNHGIAPNEDANTIELARFMQQTINDAMAMHAAAAGEPVERGLRFEQLRPVIAKTLISLAKVMRDKLLNREKTADTIDQYMRDHAIAISAEEVDELVRLLRNSV